MYSLVVAAPHLQCSDKLCTVQHITDGDVTTIYSMMKPHLAVHHSAHCSSCGSKLINCTTCNLMELQKSTLCQRHHQAQAYKGPYTDVTMMFAC